MKSRIGVTGAMTLAAAIAAVVGVSGFSANVEAGSSAGASPAGMAQAKKVLRVNRAPAQTSFDRFIVRYRDEVAAQRDRSMLTNAVNAAAMRAGVAGLKAGVNGVKSVLSVKYERKLAVGAHLVRLSRSMDQAEANALLAQLRADPAVKYAQPDYRVQLLDFTPNDPRFNLQWHYTHPTAGIGAPAAWDNSQGEGIVVAVIDTGYLDHTDLNENIVPGYDFVSDVDNARDGDGRDTDAHDPGDYIGNQRSSWHGTHVAGTVAAVTNNGLGLAGVAFNARVQPVRVMGPFGGTMSDIIDAIVWASGGTVSGAPDNATPAEVINMSLGGFVRCSEVPAMQAAINEAVGRGVTVVVASGNADWNAADFSPAGCDNVLTVGATGVDGGRSYYSNYGTTVALSAPGGNATTGDAPSEHWIWSLGNSGLYDPVPSPAGDAMMGLIGTSMASPHVAGVVALMQSAAVNAGLPPLTPQQVKTVVKQTATPFSVPPPAAKPQGAGIVNATAAVSAASQPYTGEIPITLANRVPLNGQTATAGESLLYRITVPAGKASLNLRTYGGTGEVALYVAQGRVPTTADFDRKSVKVGNSEAVVYTSPLAGTYYLRVVADKAAGGLTVLAVY